MRDGDGTGSRDGRPCRECSCRGANRERGLRGRGQGVHAVIGAERCETNVEREPWRARLWIAWVAGCTRRRPGKQALAFCQVSRVFIISRLFAGSANPRMHDLLSAARDWIEKRNADPGRAAVRPLIDTHASIHSRTMSSAMATQQFAANVLRTGARSAGRTAPVRAARMTVRAAASNGGLPIDLRGEF